MNPRQYRWSGMLIAVTCIAFASACGAETSSTDTNPSGNKEDKKMGVAAIDAFIAEQKIDTSKAGWKTSLPKPEKVNFEADQKIYWMLKTNKGNIKIRLMSESAPMHVSSTIYLTRLGFYDDTIFHRVISGFMAQAAIPSDAELEGLATSTAANLRAQPNTTSLEFSAWRMQGLGPMGVSSSSPSSPRLIWMANTPSSVKWSKEWERSRPWKRLDPGVVRPRNR